MPPEAWGSFLHAGGAGAGRKPRSKGGATSDRKSRSNGGTAGDRKPRSASDAGCCVCVRSDLEAVELILLVDGDPDSCVVMAPAQAVELARRLWSP